MYEIWLALNIAYETALLLWPYIAVGLGLWLVLLRVAGHRLGRRAVAPALAVGAAAAVLAFAALPALSRSSFADMGYWVDWANLLALALASGAVVALFAYPLASLWRRPAGPSA